MYITESPHRKVLDFYIMPQGNEVEPHLGQSKSRQGQLFDQFFYSAAFISGVPGPSRPTGGGTRTVRHRQPPADGSTPLKGRQLCGGLRPPASLRRALPAPRPELVERQSIDQMPEGLEVQGQCNSSCATKVRKSLAEDLPNRQSRERDP